ncbi:16S rRNA (adenine(1518)-N(6)/adenine(1519)-N(6))-dimethyltransferase RsmA [Gammaproteobacteria bacterium]|jgi:16S rRNA (adenine1518-N6/adenine1519-N6)-dimethyltransferase|nr:16S rRNA (adenine(1518)-N(6)/adenine(1519)-N(6))-dimethyltransferase RsmA [Gammaproteobacteria bacterium]
MNSDNYHARKRFGQNFLHDQNIIQRIVDSINPQNHEHIIEIGPGKGALTFPLLNRVKKLNVIEIDKDLAAKLRTNIEDKNRLIIHEKDALDLDFSIFNHTDLRIVGNLPYNISTPILFHLLKYRECIKDMTFMLQKEVVERICANSGNKKYGRLSIMLQYYCDVESLFNVKPEAFIPIPKIESALVKLIPVSHPRHELLDHECLKIIVRESFSQRRKTIRNALKKYLDESTIINAGIAPENRAENLEVCDFITLANCYHRMKTNIL